MADPASTSHASALDLGPTERTLNRIASRKRANQDGTHIFADTLLRGAVAAWRNGNIEQAANLSAKAANADANDSDAQHLLGIVLERLGRLRLALAAYARARTMGADADLLLHLGFLAHRLNVNDLAEAAFRDYIQREPASPLGYNNLASVLESLGRIDAAINLLRDVIFRMPGEAVLWASLASILGQSGRYSEGLIFCKEALRLNPLLARNWHNLGTLHMQAGEYAEALIAFDQALAFGGGATDDMEGRFSRGICLLSMGMLEEGFRETEIRNSPGFRNYVEHRIDAAPWRGEPLAGKNILIIGEQGVGDEVMFANIVPDLIRAVGDEGEILIAVEPRLVPLFRRSFPQAEVGSYSDRRISEDDGSHDIRKVHWAGSKVHLHFHTQMGSALQYLRASTDAFPKQAYLKPDDARVAEYRERLVSCAKGKRLVGLNWRSMLLGRQRILNFCPLPAWEPVFTTAGVTFVNLQYGECQDELAFMRDGFKTDIVALEGLDLKNDLDGAAALASACDLVISAPTAAAALAGAVGAETWFVVPGRGWPQLGADHYPWYRQTKVFAPRKLADWNDVMPALRAALENFVHA